MDPLYDLWNMALAWALAQPRPVQIVLLIALLPLAYFLYVLVAITFAALYAAFFR